MKLAPGFCALGRWKTVWMPSRGEQFAPWEVWLRCYKLHRCITLMATHRDAAVRPWGPLLCHLSTSTASCCSVTEHKHSKQFMEAETLTRRRHPLSVFTCRYPPQSTTRWSWCKGDAPSTSDTDLFSKPSVVQWKWPLIKIKLTVASSPCHTCVIISTVICYTCEVDRWWCEVVISADLNTFVNNI